MDYKILGIDFSLNSPAFCLMDGEICKWGSLYRTEKIVDKMLDKETSPFKILKDTGKFQFEFIPKNRFTGEYYEVEKNKLSFYEDATKKFFSFFADDIDKNTKVFMEGISFGSSGNSLIDISMATALLRSKIRYIVGSDNLFIFSPSSIKKFALKGNAKKDELYKALIDKHQDNKNLEFLVKILKQNQETWIKGKKNEVETPCSDIIDATWISLFGINFLNEREKLNEQQ